MLKNSWRPVCSLRGAKHDGCVRSVCHSPNLLESNHASIGLLGQEQAQLLLARNGRNSDSLTAKGTQEFNGVKIILLCRVLEMWRLSCSSKAFASRAWFNIWLLHLDACSTIRCPWRISQHGSLASAAVKPIQDILGPQPHQPPDKRIQGPQRPRPSNCCLLRNLSRAETLFQGEEELQGKQIVTKHETKGAKVAFQSLGDAIHTDPGDCLFCIARCCRGHRPCHAQSPPTLCRSTMPEGMHTHLARVVRLWPFCLLVRSPSVF